MCQKVWLYFNMQIFAYDELKQEKARYMPGVDVHALEVSVLYIC